MFPVFSLPVHDLLVDSHVGADLTGGLHLLALIYQSFKLIEGKQAHFRVLSEHPARLILSFLQANFKEINVTALLAFALLG